MHQKFIGIFGERAALCYFLRRNYLCCTKNYRTRFGEIDLVVRKGSTYHFVEVKTRTVSLKNITNNRNIGFHSLNPEYYVSQKKQERFLCAVYQYCNQYQLFNVDVHFDVVAVRFFPHEQLFRIRYFPSCFCNHQY